MGLRNWWRSSRERAALNRQSLAINDDKELRASQVPELVGMSDVEAMAYVLQQIDDWKTTCSADELSVFRERLLASNESFDTEGLTMPYWANLWVLRTFQRQLGLNVPHVAPPVGNVAEG